MNVAVMEKSLRKEASFSSMILDEISRSIDGTDEKFYKGRSTSAKKHGQSNSSGCLATKADRGSVVNNEQMGSHKLEKQGNDKGPYPRNSSTLFQVDDPPLLGTTSSSGELSSSDIEFFPSTKSRRPYSATRRRPKRVSKSVSPRWKQKPRELSMGDYQDEKSNETEEHQAKSKFRTLKTYPNLMKMKDLISSYGRLTSFIKKIFPIENSRKAMKFCFSGCYEDRKVERKSKYRAQTSYSSFSNHV